MSNPNELNRIIVKRDNGPVYLQDVASISFKEKEITSYTRSFDKKTVMLEVVKRGGENAIFASNSIQEIIEEAKESFLPANLEVVVQNDQSEYTINSVNDLMNNLIFGIILVVTVLTFFSRTQKCIIRWFCNNQCLCSCPWLFYLLLDLH